MAEAGPQLVQEDDCHEQQLKHKLNEHEQSIGQHGQALPEIRNWKWNLPAVKPISP